MRKQFINIVILILSVYSLGQTTTENYIRTTEYLSEEGEGGDKKTVLVYFDGLGREKQLKQIGASPNPGGIPGDLVVHFEYDGFGRQLTDYLPVPVELSAEEITDNILLEYNSFYNAIPYNTNYYYSEKTLENSPLGRVLKQSAPGETWRKGGGHEIMFSYLSNAVNEVRLFKVNRNNGALVDGGYYAEQSLYKFVTTDENGNKTAEFKDKQGRIVLRRSFVEANQTVGKPIEPEPYAEKVDTYYVYDIYGNLSFVIPPLAAAKSTITAANRKNLCYQYIYDDRNRLIEKKLPGKEWEFIVYDRKDRIVATRDANMEADRKWLFTKYDKFGRTVYTGIMLDARDRASLQNFVNDYFPGNEESRSATGFSQNGITVYYTQSAFPASFSDVLTVNYYDKYVNLNAYGFNKPVSAYDSNLRKEGNGKLKGMATETHIRILGTDQWEKTVSFYDQKSRPVRTYKQNHLGGYTDVDSDLNFRGLPLETATSHIRNPNAIEAVNLKDLYTYDTQGRLLSHKQKINGGTAQLIAANSYDRLGRPVSKKVGGTADGSDRWQEINYSYNIRGWLTGINDTTETLNGAGQHPGGSDDDLFAFGINYEQPAANGGPATALYNGNISQTFWKTGDNVLRGYDYGYDMLNRLRSADFYNGTGVPFTGAYTENVGYDINGNITGLLRTTGNAMGEPIDMDILSYAYQGGNGNSNLLIDVSDAASVENSEGFIDGNTNPNQKDYSYDANGNMVKDRNKGIKTITYNHLNLPLRISMTNFQFIDYQYNALGQKVSKTVTDNEVIKVVDYLDGFQYAGEVLQFFPHAEGYVTAVGKKQLGSEEITGYKYRHIYNYTDHLGNVRLSFSTRSNGRLEVMNENHYFPFGLKHTVYVPPTKQVFVLKPGESEFDLNVVTKTPYLYEFNGKEWQDELGLNMNDFGARNYDPALGRWMNIDPLAEVSRRFSPYTYALNNPVYFIDPDGMTAESSEGGSEGPGDVKLTGGIGLDSTMAFNFISYTGYGQNASSSKQNNASSSNNNSFSDIIWEGGDPNAIELEEVVITDMNHLEGAIEERVNDAMNIWRNWGNSTIPSWVGNINDGVGGFGTGLQKAGGTFRLTNGAYNGNKISPKLYSSGWKGGSRAQIKTYSSMKYGKVIGKGSIAGTVVLGSISIYDGYQQDGGTFGQNAAVATGGAVGGGFGAWGGAKLGAGAGFMIGGPVGAIVGGVIGGVAGGIIGAEVGEAAVNSTY